MSCSFLRSAILLCVVVSLGCSKGAGPQTSRPSAPPSVATPRQAASPGRAAAAVKDSQSQQAASASPVPASAIPPPGAPYWPRFHGPKGDNLSADTGLLKEWPEGGPKLLWTAKGLGPGFASVTLANGLIYTAGNNNDKTMITAMDMEGKIRWQTDNGAAWTGDSPGTRGTPTIDGDRLYHESPLGEVTCMSAKRGEKQWNVNILKEFEGENITWALAESLLTDGDRVICCPGGSKASVAALDKMTGKTVWTSKPTGVKTSYATPVLTECEGLRMILTMNSKAFLAVNADNGDLLFTVPHETRYDVNATSPIYHDGHVFICSGYGSGAALFKLKVDGQKASVEQVWESKELDNHHGGVILLDGYLYGAAQEKNRGGWICLDWKTGEKMCAEKGVGKGSLTYADGMLYTLSEQRDMGLVPATPKEHKVVSKFKIPSGGDGPSWAHPVVCGGRLYVRHSDQLFAYDVRAGQ
jgi:outer membrane protein assembly factor BamB